MLHVILSQRGALWRSFEAVPFSSALDRVHFAINRSRIGRWTDVVRMRRCERIQFTANGQIGGHHVSMQVLVSSGPARSIGANVGRTVHRAAL